MGSTLNHGFTGILFYKNTDLVFLSREKAVRQSPQPLPDCKDKNYRWECQSTAAASDGRFLPKQNTLFRVAAHEKGCFVWILPWCEEESCYTGNGCGPASHGKSITAFTIQFVKKLWRNCKKEMVSFGRFCDNIFWLTFVFSHAKMEL